jgi:hypothetical protein
MMKKISRQVIFALLFVMTAAAVSAQIKIKPRILDVAEAYENHSFVLVLKATDRSPAKVIMSDFKADTEEFDPMKMDSYPRWQFSNFTLMNNDGTSERYLSMRCVDTGKYLKYRRSYGQSIMVDKEEYEERMKRDDKNAYVHSIEDIMEFYKRPLVSEDTYIRLGIYNKEGKSLVVTPSDWHTREFKLIYVE